MARVHYRGSPTDGRQSAAGIPLATVTVTGLAVAPSAAISPHLDLGPRPGNGYRGPDGSTTDGRACWSVTFDPRVTTSRGTISGAR
ncbi:hypothetical protein H3M12_01340 [Levilactobacillus suantsaii]|nr:hypothetical protein H3M12_01340 [Levilactobacillus suantsaii]